MYATLLQLYEQRKENSELSKKITEFSKEIVRLRSLVAGFEAANDNLSNS